MSQTRKRHWSSAFWVYLTRYWNSTLAATAVLGYLVLAVIPGANGRWQTACLFLGANAALWTLIEIKLKSEQTSRPSWFRSMRSARNDILRSIRSVISRRHRRTVRIWIIGGRIRTVSDMLLELFEEIVTGQTWARNVDFVVCCVNPSAMRDWVIYTLKDHVAFRQTVARDSKEVELEIEELRSFNQHEVFQKNQVRVSVVRYDSFPAFYAFVLDDSEIYWGYYTWNGENEDFDGPVNPCFRVHRREHTFESYFEWFTNRVEFFQLARPAAVTLHPEKGSDCVHRSSDALEHVLRTNKQAYDSLASHYNRTGAERAKKMQQWLGPLYDELEQRFKDSKSVLELGPGDGSLAKVFLEHGHRVTAIDFSPRMCMHVRENAPEAKLIEAEFLEFDFGKRQYHAVIAIAFIHLFPSPWDQSVLQKIRDLLCPNGVAFLSTTVHELADEGYSPKSEPSNQPLRYRKRYKREHFERLIRQAGLRIVKSYDNEDGFIGGKYWMDFIVERTKDLGC